MSIRKIIFTRFSICISAIILIAGVFNCYQTYSLLKNSLVTSIRESLNLGVNNIDYYLQDANNRCSSILVNSEITAALNREFSDDLESKQELRALSRMLSQYISTCSYITKVYLINQDHVALDKDISSEQTHELEQLIPKHPGTLTITPPHRVGYIVGNNKAFSMTLPVYEKYNKNKILGTLVADLDYRVIDNIIHDFKLPVNGYLFLTDRDFNVLVSSTDEVNITPASIEQISGHEGFSHFRFENQYFYTVSHGTDTAGWNLTLLIPAVEIFRFILPQLLLSVLFVIISIIAIAMLSRSIIRYIYIPLDKLTDSMKTVQSGSLDVSVNYDRQDEFATVINGYNSMIDRIQHLLAEVKEKEEMKRNSELYALQAQISPHFLYNSLNSIRYFAKSRKAPEIYDMTTALIQLAQASLSSEKFITISQELELTEQYLVIQKIRYGDCFRFTTDIDEELKACLIPRFSIQPIVENALFHGLIPAGSGTIQLMIRSRRQGIEIRVRDDGVGISDEQLNSINDVLENNDFVVGVGKTSTKLKNIGLENINYRIRSNYESSEGGVSLSPLNHGTEVTLIIPERIYEYENSPDH